ncbi:MAG: T9SS type A sorting domain-containing protein, partial [Bacteroidales bacterium]|nr:T9SS type A sorting domain-containing protein [Bacteroidales bacterium]
QFNANPEDEPGRFLIHFADFAASIKDNNLNNESIQIYSYKKDIYVNFAERTEGEVVIYSLLGKELYRKHIKDQNLNKITINNASGYLIVKFINNDFSKTQKVFISK